MKSSLVAENRFHSARAFKRKQLDEVRGGVRRSLPARGSKPNPRYCRSQLRGEGALLRLLGAPSTVRLLRGYSELLQRSFSFAAKQGRACWGDSFAGCGWATAARDVAGRRRRGDGVDCTGPCGGGVERTALAALRRRSGARAP